jgi:ribosomal protein S18 acetylase RimI-like enzyme
MRRSWPGPECRSNLAAALPALVVLEVAENNEQALEFYRSRNSSKLDAAIFLARKLEQAQELLPPRRIKVRRAAG